MKLLKSLLAIVITIISFISPAVVLADTLPSSIHVVTTPPQPGNTWYVENLETGTKTIDGGGVAYCLDYHKNTPLDTTVTLGSELDAGLAYIIQNGFPNKSITGDNNKDYYITQVAIWMYLDEVHGMNNLKDAVMDPSKDVLTYARKLVDAAKTAKYKNPSIAISVDNKKLSISEDKNYFVSDAITVNAVDVDSFKVSLVGAPEGSYTTDVNGNKKDTFTSGEKVVVYVPADTENVNFKITATATVNNNKVYRYNAAASGEQDILPAIIYPESKTVSSEMELNVEIEEIIEVPDTNTNPIFMYIFGGLLTISGIGFARNYAKKTNK